MAVAAHVSRVAKDYAPHGYSVMEDVTLAFYRLAGSESDAGNLVHTVPIAQAVLPVDDAGIYVESAHIFIGTKVGTHNGSHHFNFFLKRADNDGSLSNSVELASGGSKPSSFGTMPNAWTPMGVDQNQVVAKDKVLYVHITSTGTVTSLAVDGLSICVRYRRKA